MHKHRLIQCGPVQLYLSRRAAARRKLRVLAQGAGLSLRELADVIGIEYATIINHLSGHRMSRGRVDWYHRVQAIELAGNVVTITLHYVPTRKRFGWKSGQPLRRLPRLLSEV